MSDAQGDHNARDTVLMRPVSLSSPEMGETTIGVVPTSRSATFALPLAGLALQPCKPRDRHHREYL